MNYARFQEAKPERDYSGIQAEIEFDTIEIEPGHLLSIELSGVFEWDGHCWIAERLYLHTYADGPQALVSMADGTASLRSALIYKTLRIDDRPDFATIVHAAERFATEHHMVEDYA